MIRVVLLCFLIAISSGYRVHIDDTNPLLTPPELQGLPRIIGGNTSDPHAYPWQISFQLKQLGRFSHICGGSVIDEHTVVCAAHCVVGQVEEQVQIVAGAHNIAKDVDNSWQIRKIAKLLAHEDYDSYDITNDISLIKLSEPLELNEFVQPVKLAASGEMVEAGTMCLNTGWGYTHPAGWGSPDELQVVSIPIIEQETCVNIYQDIGLVYDGEICAGGPDQGACNGDSGGPLVCENGDGDLVLHGIVSWGMRPCAQEQYPSVFTRVSYFRDWIEENRV